MRYTWILVLVCVGLSCVDCSRGSGTAATKSERGSHPVVAEERERRPVRAEERQRRRVRAEERERYRVSDEGISALRYYRFKEAKVYIPLPDLIHPAGDLARQMRESLETRFDRFEAQQLNLIDWMLTLLENPGEYATEQDEREILAYLTREMMQTGVSSQVTFTTAVDGAVVKYQAYGYDDIGTANGTTQDASAELPIGCYWFWSERNSKRNSKSLLKTILRENEGPIPIQEYGDD